MQPELPMHQFMDAALMYCAGVRRAERAPRPQSKLYAAQHCQSTIPEVGLLQRHENNNTLIKA